MNSSRFISAVLFGLACYLGSFSAFANEQAIEEIIVTARQQSEGLQDVPVTIAALTEEDLDRYNINNLVDAGKMVPNMVIAHGGSGNGANQYCKNVSFGNGKAGHWVDCQALSHCGTRSTTQ